jgi:hypothetical protein
VSSRRGITIASLGLHDVGDETCLSFLMTISTGSSRTSEDKQQAILIWRSVTEAHGANMDVAGSDDVRNLGVDEGCVTALSLRACSSTKSGTVVVEELLCEVAACNCYNSCISSDVAINQVCASSSKGPDCDKTCLLRATIIGSSAVMLAGKARKHLSS